MNFHNNEKQKLIESLQFANQGHLDSEDPKIKQRAKEIIDKCISSSNKLYDPKDFIIK